MEKEKYGKGYCLSSWLYDTDGTYKKFLGMEDVQEGELPLPLLFKSREGALKYMEEKAVIHKFKSTIYTIEECYLAETNKALKEDKPKPSPLHDELIELGFNWIKNDFGNSYKLGRLEIQYDIIDDYFAFIYGKHELIHKASSYISLGRIKSIQQIKVLKEIID